MKNSEDKKKAFNQSVDDDKLDNVVNESETLYQTQQMEDFEMSQEWVDEIEERSRRFRSGEDKGFTHDEIMKMAFAHLATFQNNRG